MDLSAALPSTLVFRFPTRRCAGQVSQTVPSNYVKTIKISDVITQGAPAGNPAPLTFHEYALALYDPANQAKPTNQAALDRLALQFSTDLFNWLGVSFDRVYNGVLSPIVSPIYHDIIIDYGVDSATTRLQSAVSRSLPEELMHHDPANSSCTDANNGGTPVGQAPCGYVYGPPGYCANNYVVLTVYKICIIDGRLVQTYVRQDTIK